MLLQTIFALAAVCGLAYVIFRVILPGLQVIPNQNGMVRVVERVGLDAKRSLVVVEVAGKWIVLGVSDNGVNMVCELDAAEAQSVESEIVERRELQTLKFENLRSGFAEKLASVMNGKKAKNREEKPDDEKNQSFWSGKK